jgi:hypothetical protein
MPRRAVAGTRQTENKEISIFKSSSYEVIFITLIDSAANDCRKRRKLGGTEQPTTSPSRN